jgi:glycerate dehydrogenase
MPERIVFLDRDTIAPHVTIRQPEFEHDWISFDRTPADQVAERLKGATVAITNKAPIHGGMLDGLPDLRMISIAATGSDVIDLDACSRRDIVVSNVQGYAVNTVPEHTFSLILALRRSLIGYVADVRGGEWQKAAQFCFFNHPISDLNGARLGIFGGGAIGSAVARIAKAFGMEVVFAARKGVNPEKEGYLSFDDVVETADVLTFHCPLTPETRSMIGADEFRRMKNDAIVVNTARGGLIDEDALCAAIESNQIAGAGIDVVSAEPPADGHPYYQLAGRPNFILTPHVGWASTEAMQEVAEQVITNIENFVQGLPSNRIA